MTKTLRFNKRYVPKKLNREDKKIQAREIIKSRKLYKQGILHKRPKLKSFKTQKSKHIIKAEKIYKIKNMKITDELAKATGCEKKALKKIVNKGAGAYYSSGSRPNQSAESWGLARLASAITGGKASAVDYKILLEGCKSNSKALTLAKKAKKKYGNGTRKAPKTNIKIGN